MNLLYPKFPANRLPFMVRIALLGGVVAGSNGAVHDQVSYAISPEYFTKLKFKQFSWADFGWPPRLFAGEVGFLATWWVGCSPAGSWPERGWPSCRRPSGGNMLSTSHILQRMLLLLPLPTPVRRKYVVNRLIIPRHLAAVHGSQGSPSC
jgi:hypothetical protein